MFSATFLGHQGWLVTTGTTTVLVDPLLTQGFGLGGEVGVVYPPRKVLVDRLPRIDAVILTHEHDDHFDVPSLARLDRKTPVFFSARASGVAWDQLGRMGFAVGPIRSGEELEIGDLRYMPFGVDHDGGRQGDEWDVLPFVLRDAAGHGNLVSSVDVRPRDDFPTRARAVVPQPGIWCYANNATAAAFGDATEGDTDALARVVSRRRARIEQSWGRPAATVICGAGWSFPEPRAWLNHRVFPIDNAALADALGDAMAAVPGQTLVMKDGAFDSVTSSDLVECPPRSAWPDRTFAPVDERPLTAARTHPPAEDLLPKLDDFARYLYGTPLFRALHSADDPVDVSFKLLGAEGIRILVYEPRNCRFEERDTTTTSGWECHAADLSAFLYGTLAPSALCNAGRLRTWNTRPDLLRVTAHDLWLYGHPLRRPEAWSRLYTRAAATAR